MSDEIKDLERSTQHVSEQLRGHHKGHSSAYRSKLFYMWCMLDNPSAKPFFDSISPDDRIDPITQKTLTLASLKNMVANWGEPLVEQNELLRGKLQEKVASDRAAMIERHLPQFVELQTMAMDFIREKGLGTARTAVTAFFNAVKHEREARSLPIDAFERINELDDAELVNMFAKLAQEGFELDDGTDSEREVSEA